MAPATGTALLILGAFVLPGFVTLLFRERTYAVPGSLGLWIPQDSIASVELSEVLTVDEAEATS